MNTETNTKTTTMKYQDYYNWLLRYHRTGTAKRYYYSVEQYLDLIGGEVQALYINYQGVMDIVGHYRKKGYSAQRIMTELAGIKSYHRYLCDTKQRNDHPAQDIILQDANRNRDIQHQDLFTPQELEQLLQRQNRYHIIHYRNQFILSLYIYQALTTGELTRLKEEDIKEDGSIYIKATHKTNARYLELQPKQMHYYQSYLNKERPQLLKRKNKQSRLLFISKLGTASTSNDCSYLVECQKHLFPTRKLNPKTIRQSVITNWFKQGKGIREIQIMAGHKYASTTIQYRPTNLDELTSSLAMFHPLG